MLSDLFSCIQTFITNVIMKPKIKAQVEAEMKANPPKTVVTPRKDVTPEKPATSDKKALNNGKNNSSGRNAGKQQRK